MKVRWTTAAAEDLREIALYIRKDNPEAARRVAQRIFHAANSLEQFPNRGRVGRVAGTREWVISEWPYIIVYRVQDSSIEILRIYHGAQKAF